MSRVKCKEWMKKYNYPTPPRSACTYCPFHNNDEWLHIKNSDSKEWQEVLEFDRFIRDKSKNKDEELFLYSKKIPLDKANFKKEFSPIIKSKSLSILKNSTEDKKKLWSKIKEYKDGALPS